MNLAPALALILATGIAGVGYVLPVERVVREMARIRESVPPLRARLEVVMHGQEDEPPLAVVAEIHPRLGVRLYDDYGRRWLVRGGQISTRPGLDNEPWIPRVEVLVAQTEEGLLAWLDAAGVSREDNALARCGEVDCFVLGGRSSLVQVWVDKDQFDVRRMRFSDGGSIDFEQYKLWETVRFPQQIKVLDPNGPVALIRVLGVDPAPGLDAESFAPSWLE